MLYLEKKPPMLTIGQVAERCAVTYHTVLNWIKSGKLKASHAGRTVRIDPTDLEAFLTNYPTKGENADNSPRHTQAS